MGAGRESSYMPDMTRKRAFRIGRSRTGLGLFATAPIKNGAFIVEYKGRKLTTEQSDKLEARGNRYLYEINSRWTIDGTSRKNLGRYANHSCRPNAETHRIGHKVIIRAIKNIKAGAEITYNYGRDYLTNVTRGVAANATSVGRNEPVRARRHAPKADEPVPPPHLAVLDGTRAVGLMRTRRRPRDLPRPRWAHAFSSSARMLSLRDRS